MMEELYTRADVASHKTAEDLWIIISNNVYDVTQFQEKHPGGEKSKQCIRTPPGPTAGD